MTEASRCLILAGPTREYIDPVRYISNASSGLQGIALAEEALERGYKVELVLGPVEYDPPGGAEVINVLSAAEMLAAATERHPGCSILIGAAAVSDFRPAVYNTSKHKRDGEELGLQLEPTEDILAFLGQQKAAKVHAGFALETDRHLDNARSKLEAKNLDWIVVNDAVAIGQKSSDYHILGADGSTSALGHISKRELAANLLDRIETAGS
ncbi:MAG: phosphopantothenoylcysteine decarboxylase [Planctomycetota bacterium]|jgi:phosphopantothenoylcysteine synthetase/decarboxylase